MFIIYVNDIDLLVTILQIYLQMILYLRTESDCNLDVTITKINSKGAVITVSLSNPRWS